MATDPYEMECMRAELLGLEKPDKEQFLLQEAERIKNEQEALENEQAKELEIQEESMNRSGGKLDELNTILSKTQKRLNRFKQTACDSFSSVFKGSFDKDAETTIHQKDDGGQIANNDNTNTNENNERGGRSGGDINVALNNLETIQSNVNSTKDTSLNIQKKMTSHLDKLDALISKADQAELSMSEQSKQMRRAINK